MSRASPLLRGVLAAAAAYNLAFGAYAALRPGAFFDALGMEPPRYPGIWACLGMVLALYGFLYAYAALRPERGAPIVAVGLAGKVLGPIGMAVAVGDGWPPRAAILCLYNDLLWWLPFAWFLVRDKGLARRIHERTPFVCSALHALALVLLLLVLGGTEAEPDVLARRDFVSGHAALWRACWIAWMAAALSLVALYAWWARRAGKLGGIAVAVAAAGLVADWTGEFVWSVTLLERAPDLDAFAAHLRTGTLLTAGVANGLYTIGGALLTLGTPGIPRPIRALLWLTWVAGALMTAGAIAGDGGLLQVSSGILFPALIAWTAWMGRRWRDAS